MPANDVFSKDAVRKVIKANLPILRQCVKGSIYRQRTAVVLLMQFIEYLLKYKIQSASKRFDRTHEIERLYDDLTVKDRNDIENRFSKLMEDRETYYSGSFHTVAEFARRFKTSYQFWRYDILRPNFELGEDDERYFYLADTVTVLRALIESTGIGINPSALPNEDELVYKIPKPVRVR